MSHSVVHFLQAIKEKPEDIALRMVFADWLTDRGDLRGELIHLEEQMRQLPPYSDDYWKLKPRRNELRKKCENSFLQAMDYGTSYHPVFTEVPNDWKSRWRLVREWTERWYQIELPDVGRVGDDVGRIASLISKPLSLSIIEWMAYTEDLESLEDCNAKEMLRDGRRIADFPEHHSISLNLQAEQDAHWAVPYKDADLLDPPVETYVLDYSNPNYPFANNTRCAFSPVTEFSLQ